MFSLICAWINGWVNNPEAGDLRRHLAHYDVIVIYGSMNHMDLLVINSSPFNAAYMSQWNGSAWVCRLNQCWRIINWTLRDKRQRNSNQNTFPKMHLKILSVKWQPFCSGRDKSIILPNRNKAKGNCFIFHGIYFITKGHARKMLFDHSQIGIRWEFYGYIWPKYAIRKREREREGETETETTTKTWADKYHWLSNLQAIGKT